MKNRQPCTSFGARRAASCDVLIFKDYKYSVTVLVKTEERRYSLRET